ncbi:MAG: alpha/beta hydrolase [Chloroflexi bacterium]|nr:alpha/beta hydrolase [Chloroflexota bacterium]
MPNVDLGDVVIHYEEAGDGPLAYVYCHGLGQSGDGFLKEFDYWRQHFPRVVTWDNRGLGRSSQAAKYSLPLYASDLARLLDAIGVQRAVAHGVSWGGVVVQQFAIDHPRTCAAIIIDSSSSEVNLAASEGWYRRGDSARHTEFAGAMVKPEHLESFIASARTVAGLREHPLTPRLRAIACPALIVASSKDTTTGGAGGSVIMARNIPNATLKIYDEGGHAIYSQLPEAFRALVLEFCREHRIIT